MENTGTNKLGLGRSVFLYLAAMFDWNFEGALAAGFMFEGLLGPPELPNLMTDGLPLFGG